MSVCVCVCGVCVCVWGVCVCEGVCVGVCVCVWMCVCLCVCVCVVCVCGVCVFVCVVCVFGVCVCACHSHRACSYNQYIFHEIHSAIRSTYTYKTPTFFGTLAPFSESYQNKGVSVNLLIYVLFILTGLIKALAAKIHKIYKICEIHIGNKLRCFDNTAELHLSGLTVTASIRIGRKSG
jgi:hypothetical protein